MRVAQTPVVQDAWRSGRSLAIHGWVYGLDDGVIRDLGCTVSGDGDMRRSGGPAPA